MLWLFFALIAVWMGLWFVPYSVNGMRPLPECIALIPMLCVPLVVLMGVAAVSQAWFQLCFGVLLLIVQLVWCGASYVNLPAGLLHFLRLPERRRGSVHLREGDSRDAEDSQLQVMTLNCRFGRADAAELLRKLQSEKIDILALQEVSWDLVDALDKAGIGLELPYHCIGKESQNDNGGFNALYARCKPVEQSTSSVDILAANIPTISIEIRGRRIRFASAHPKSPGRGGRFWQLGIERLSGFSKRITSLHEAPSPQAHDALPSYAPSPQDTVVMGDLNSSLYHPVFRNLISTSGLADATYELRAGFHPSFPSSWKYVPAMLELDHVLLTEGIVPRDIAAITISGSDHKAMIATIALVH